MNLPLPSCPSCNGVLLPLSDYAPEGASVLYKAWACSRQQCGYVIRADKGVVAYERVGVKAPDHHPARRQVR